MLVNSATAKISERRAEIGFKVLRVRTVGDESILTSVFSKGRYIPGQLTTHQHKEGLIGFGTLEDALAWAQEIAGLKVLGNDLLQIHRVRFSGFNDCDYSCVVDYSACRRRGGKDLVRSTRTKFWEIVRKGDEIPYDMSPLIKDAPEGTILMKAVRVLKPMVTLTCASFRNPKGS